MKPTRSRTAWTTTALTATLAAGVLNGTAASALNGAESGDGTYAFTAKINVGENSACSGALVDPLWVLTAASCFAVDGKPATAGKPAVTTTVTVGRTDLTRSGGNVVQAVDLVPHTDRDLVMVKLAWPVSATPAEIATTAPEAGEQLTSAGFGRTKTEWVPNKLHSATFTVAGVEGGTLSLNGSEDAVICQGDAGGPALRTKGGKTELVAINSLSWQGGCLGTDAAETRTGAVDVRVDDVAAWVGQVRQSTPAVRLQSLIPNVTNVMTTGDFNRDGRSDVAAITKDGNLYTFAARTDGTFEFGRPLWATDGSWTGMKKIIGGDFNGDGISDIAAVWGNGALRLYAGQADGSLAAGKAMWSDEKTNWNDMLQLTRFKADNSGRDGLLAVWNAGNRGDLYAYAANADGTLAGGRKMWPDSSWVNMNKVTAGDFNNDGLDDVVALAGDGSLLRYNGNTSGGLDKGTSIWPDKGWGTMPVVLSGDFNGDGNTDLGGLWNNQQRFNLYKGDGKGSIAGGTNAWPSPLPLPATGQLHNANSGKCLEIGNSSKDNGARAQQWTCGTQAGATWQFRPTTTDGLYEIVNAGSGKCLEIDSSSKSDGARAQQWTCTGAATQRWTLQPAGNTVGLNITNANSGKTLEIADANTANGAFAQQWTHNTDPTYPTQTWYL